ncbi:4Fe-4S binding protein [Rhodoferax sp.]|uniref:4Fe-4S binding protein n=1 Tax=Rhodoferax sp. TaxID=50421 RepID=UPI00275FB6E1|nr:4Fe-4S binding protein [Rhodoferax sp.]
MTSQGNARAELEYRPLREDHPLGLLADACLALRAPRYATCRACESECPVKAIRVGETAIELAENCVRCGRCAAACPMGALAHCGFAVPQAPRESARQLGVDCWKVPVKLSPEGAVRVPCLGGLSPARIAELVVSAGASSVELLDRGWCGGCSAGGTAVHPAEAGLTQVRRLLEEGGVQASRVPRLRTDPLPPHLMPTQIPAPVTETKLGRRGFFSMLGAKTAVAVDKVMPVAQAQARRRRGFEKTPVLSMERERLLRGTALIAKSAGVTPPRGLFFRVRVSSTCSNHQLCASICPTGALAVFEQGGRTELMFDTGLCIGCQVCRAICPSGALTVLPNGYSAIGDVLPDHRSRLTSFGEKSCPECARVYTVRAGEDEVCPQCQKRRQLASSAFQSLFGPRC